MDIVQAIKDGEAQLLDVRGKDEWKAGHAEGAIHISVQNLITGYTGDLDQEKPVYVYCASGGRAGTAESYLRSLGYDATNIGGLGNWAAAGGAVVR